MNLVFTIDEYVRGLRVNGVEQSFVRFMISKANF